MMNETGIGWTDLTWNVWSGCKKISAGCAHCYADTSAENKRGTLGFPHGFDLTVRSKNLDDPPRALKKHGPSLIFCESMSDLGLADGELTDAERARLSAAGFESMDLLRDAFFETVCRTPEHRYQILTKRPETLARYFRRGDDRPARPAMIRKALASCWVGVTIEHVKTLDRLNVLREFRALGARVLFVSAEPLLSDLVADGLRLDGIDWVIAGGESGTHYGPKYVGRFLVTGECGRYFPSMSRDTAMWVRRLRDEAARAGCAFFFKQWGGPRPDSGGRLLDGRTHDALPEHVPGAMPVGRRPRAAATAGLARKPPVVSS